MISDHWPTVYYRFKITICCMSIVGTTNPSKRRRSTLQLCELERSPLGSPFLKLGRWVDGCSGMRAFFGIKIVSLRKPNHMTLNMDCRQLNFLCRKSWIDQSIPLKVDKAKVPTNAWWRKSCINNGSTIIVHKQCREIAKMWYGQRVHMFFTCILYTISLWYFSI